MWQADSATDTVLIYSLLIVVVIGAWETIKAVRAYLESKKYEWIIFDSTEEASAAAQLIYDWERKSLNDIENVEFDVAWDAKTLFSKEPYKPNPLRIRVRVPNDYLTVLYSDEKFRSGEQIFRDRVEARIK